MERPAIVWRFGIWIIVIQLIGGAALLIGMRSHVLESRRRAVAAATELTASGLAGRYEELLESGADLQRATSRDAGRTRMRVFVADADGVVIADSRERDLGARIEPTPEVLAAREGGVGADSRFSSIFDEEGRHVAVMLEGGQLLHLSSPRSVIGVDWRPVEIALVATLVCMAATTGLLFGLSSTIRRVFREISYRVTAMVKGETMSPAAPELFAVDRAIRRTHRKLARQMQALNARRHEAEMILGSMADGVIAMDREQIVLSMNPAAERILGVKAADARGRLIQEATFQPSLNAFVRRGLTSPLEVSEELEFTGESKVLVQASASRLDLAHGQRGLLLVLTDVTRLRRLERIRSDFASNVSHELRTPITNIKGYVETLIQAGFDDREQAEEFLHIIRRNSVRLGAIVDDIMALTRIEQSERVGAMEMDLAPILPVLQAACDEQATEAKAKGTEIEIQASPDLEARMNPDLIEQAVSNLVSNAVRYTKPGTYVLIRASMTNEDGASMLRIDVKDSGPGIGPEHLPRLFERFYRVDKARSRGVGGTGLGLAIVKHITQAHGGEVRVESKPGIGSIFSILLPMHTAQQGAVSAPAAAP